MENTFPIIPILLLLVSTGLGLAAVGFWIWALVDCLTKESSEGNDKIIWILVILLLSWVGALIYLFVRRPQRIKELGR
mgnify:CR=1 FL=1|jgi:hypothetical protein